MDIYHSTYTQYIALMNQLKGDVSELVSQAVDGSRERDKALGILQLIDETIYTASAETFLPSGELLNIAETLSVLKGNIRISIPATQPLLKACFKTLNEAATTLRRITDDSSLRTAIEISARGIIDG